MGGAWSSAWSPGTSAPPSVPGPFPDRWWTRIDADRLRAIGSFVGGLDADVVALQEVALLSRATATWSTTPATSRASWAWRSATARCARFAVTDGDAADRRRLLRQRAPVPPADRGIAHASRCRRHRPTPSSSRSAQTIRPPAFRYADAPATSASRAACCWPRSPACTVGTAHLSHIGSGERLLQAEATVAAFGERRRRRSCSETSTRRSRRRSSRPSPAGPTASPEPPGDRARITTDDGARIDHVLARGASVHGCRVVREAGELSDHYPSWPSSSLHLAGERNSTRRSAIGCPK